MAKPPDLSQRLFPPVAGGAVPMFSGRTSTTGQASASGTFFNPRGAVTVLWTVAQVLASTTIQLLVNNAGIGAPINVAAGTVLRFPGVLLPNDAVLGFSITPSVAVNYEVVWMKDFFPEYIVQELAVMPPAAAVKNTITETTAQLGNGGVFTGAWHDTQLDGTCYVVVSAFTNIGSGIAGFVLQESDDIANANMTNILISLTALAANINKITSTIRARYWRVIYTNGVTPTTSLEITSTTFSVPITAGINAGSVSSAIGAMDTVYIAPRASATAVGDNLTLSSGYSAPNTPSISPFNVGESYYGGLFTGGGGAGLSGWSKARTPTIYKRLATIAVGPTALWTPTAGSKFRLQRFRIQLTANAVQAVAGIITLALLDAAASMGLEQSFFVPAAAAATLAGHIETPWIDLGFFGKLSALANNVLNVTLSTALTGGTFSIIAAGTEE